MFEESEIIKESLGPGPYFSLFLVFPPERDDLRLAASTLSASTVTNSFIFLRLTPPQPTSERPLFDDLATR